MPSTARNRGPLVPRPFFSLAILYIFGFFLLYAMLMVAPALWEVAQAPVPDAEKEALAEAAAHEAAAGRTYIAFLFALATVAMGIWAKKLPGFRSP